MSPRTTGRIRNQGLLCISLILSPALQAQVTLTDLGTMAPATYNVGHLGTLNDRASFNAGDSLALGFPAAYIQLVAGQQAAFFMVRNSESDSDDSSYPYQ